jgi:hypothetical protein
MDRREEACGDAPWASYGAKSRVLTSLIRSTEFSGYASKGAAFRRGEMLFGEATTSN